MFQYDNYLKYTTMKIREWFTGKENKISFYWPSLLLDLHPAENLCNEFKITTILCA